MSRTKRFVLLAVLLAVAFGAMVVVGHRSSSLSALRKYQAHLRARGEKLSCAELFAERKDFTNDSLAVITNAIARVGAGSRFQPGLLEMMQFTGPGRASAAWKEDRPYSSSGIAISWQEMDKALETSKAALEEIRLALRDPAPDMGRITTPFAGSRPFVAVRSAAQWLAGAALYSLHQGELEAALQNIEALAALVQLNRNDPTLVSQMIRVAIAGLGLSVSWEALQATNWTEPQLQRLQKAWEVPNLVDAVELGTVGERCMGEDCFAVIRKGQVARIHSLFVAPVNPAGRVGRVDEYALLTAYKLTSVNDDELFYLTFSQEMIDSIRLLRSRSWIEMSSNWDSNFTRLAQIAGSVQRYRYWFSMMAIPNYERAFETAVRNETLRELAITAIALKRYELKNGGQPSPNLDALVPQFLTVIPRDYFSTGPLRYRLTPDGPLLYSVGRDGRDDQGDSSPSQPNQAPGLWVGRDLVWPRLSVSTNR